jgi:hypothetical protein
MNVCFCLNSGDAILPESDHPWATLYRKSSSCRHSMVSSPNNADLVVFTESENASRHIWNDFTRSDVYIRNKSKSIVFNERDNPYSVYPGLYTSIRKNLYDRKYYRSVPYLKALTEAGVGDILCVKRPILYSFLGCATHPLRKKIVAMRHSADTHVELTPGLLAFNVYSKPENWSRVKPMQENMIQIGTMSKYMLCPRGASPNSYRIYESMSYGAIPVIIADQLVLPFGIDWAGCAIQIPENSISSIDKILRSRNDIGFLQASVQQTYRSFFAPEAKFNYLISIAEDLSQSLETNFSKSHVFRVKTDRLLQSLMYRLRLK